MKESAIERDFCRKAEKLGIINLKLGQDGWPDRLFIFPSGMVAFVEFKTPSGKPSKSQAERMDLLAKYKCTCFYIRDSDIEVVKSFARAVDKDTSYA